MATVFTKRALLKRISPDEEVRLYRDRGKVAVVIEFQGRLHFLGRYESEEDALAIYKRYASEVERTGNFVARKACKVAGNFQSATAVYATPLSQSSSSQQVHQQLDGAQEGTGDAEGAGAGVEAEIKQVFGAANPTPTPPPGIIYSAVENSS